MSRPGAHDPVPRPVEDEEAAFLRAFEDCTLPASRFRHADHVRLAWRMLGEGDLPDALRRFREGLKRYATSLGQPGLYHETITVAYLLLIHERKAQSPRSESFTTFAARNPDLLTWRPSVLARYYREETLGSERARRTFLLPDRLEGPSLEDAPVRDRRA